MKVIVDADTCTGCGLCSDTCPEVFELGDDDVAVVKVDTVPPEHEEAVRESVEGCPVEAISTEEE
ncbi:MAG: ferredoxin [Planctomycetota bacterium]